MKFGIRYHKDWRTRSGKYPWRFFRATRVDLTLWIVFFRFGPVFGHFGVY